MHRRRLGDNVQQQPTFDGTFVNSANPAAGRYGYSTQTELLHTFGGAVEKTAYGYTGSNCWGPSSPNSFKYLQMATASGALLGQGASIGPAAGANMYLRHRLCNASNLCSFAPCFDEDFDPNDVKPRDKYATCSQCADAGKTCNVQLDRNFARDDIMFMGFRPYDYDSKIRLTISNIKGDGYSRQMVCPPEGVDITNWNGLAYAPDLFVTLTRLTDFVEEEDDAGATGDDPPKKATAVSAAVATALQACSALSALAALAVVL